jgi:hypothetical protein
MATSHRLFLVCFTPITPQINSNIMKTALWSGVGISLAFVILRYSIRLHLRQRPTVDDYFLFGAWFCTVINSMIWQIRSGPLYTVNSMGEYASINEEPSNVGEQMNQYLQAGFAAYVAVYTGLWCVKLAFLFFFRSLGKSIRRQAVLWWWTIVFVALSFVVVIGIKASKCEQSRWPKAFGTCDTPLAFNAKRRGPRD